MAEEIRATMTTEIDYQSFTKIDTPKEERRKLNIGDIYSNAAKCLECNTVVRSKNRHDFTMCPCGALAVDGGSWYAKRMTNGEYEELAEIYADVKDNRSIESVERDRVIALLATKAATVLTEREIKVVQLRFTSVGATGTLAAIGKVFGVGRNRVRQIINDSIRKMEGYEQ